jgi:HEPN domain-containing protein
MIDVDLHVAYWRNTALEDWELAQDLLADGRIRYALFFGHLTLEKMLKAHVCRHTQDVPPRTHNLSRLAELAELSLTSTQSEVLADMTTFNLEGRYPDMLTPPPQLNEAKDYLKRAGEMFQWLIQKLS